MLATQTRIGEKVDLKVLVLGPGGTLHEMPCHRFSEVRSVRLSKVPRTRLYSVRQCGNFAECSAMQCYTYISLNPLVLLQLLCGLTVHSSAHGLGPDAAHNSGPQCSSAVLLTLGSCPAAAGVPYSASSDLTPGQA